MKTGRPIEIQITLSGEQRQELRRLAREAVGRISGAHFVLLSDQGKSVPEWGPDGLLGASRLPVAGTLPAPGHCRTVRRAASGRPPNAPHLVAIVQAQTGQPPWTFGYPESGWTVNGLLRHLRQRFRIWVSRSTLRRALPLAGFVWGRPKLVLPSAVTRTKRPK